MGNDWYWQWKKNVLHIQYCIFFYQADPIAYKDIHTAFFNATNIEYPKKKKVSFLIENIYFDGACKNFS